MNRPFPRKCATCREKAVKPINLTSYTVSVDFDGRSYPITLSDVSGTQCENCQVLILADTVDDRIDDELRKVVGLMQPAKIKERRNALNLTQKAVAQALRIGEATLCRWETGAQMQQRSMDLLLRLFFELTEVRQLVGIDSSKAENANTADDRKVLAGVEDSHLPTHWEESKPSGYAYHLVKSGLTWAAQARKQSNSNAKKQLVHTCVPSTTAESELRLAG